MDKLDLIPDQKYIFGGIQIAANQMDTLMERALKEHNLTTKQWLLCVVIQNSFDHAPTIKELAIGMGSSHQNVKQVALRLQEKGFALLEKDPQDARVTRVHLTDAVADFGQASQEKSDVFSANLFDGISPEEQKIARKTIEKLLKNLEKMDHESR
ncbi:MarR family transcriptional regulator [Eubacteriaceae bacterium ES2]|nr:MarR family transcriptional regulator [Eubacteriaceae bacterium ES2]